MIYKKLYSDSINFKKEYDEIFQVKANLPCEEDSNKMQELYNKLQKYSIKTLNTTII